MTDSASMCFRLILACIFSFLLSACGGSGGESVELVPSPPPTQDTPSPPPTTPNPEPTPDPEPSPQLPTGNEIVPVLSPSQRPVYDGVVAVTVSLRVPDNTPENASIYITGDFENWTGGGNPDFLMEEQTDGTFEITFNVDAGSTISYKFTRGSWAIEEASELGNRVGNRSSSFTDMNSQVRAEVKNWIDLSSPVNNPYTGYWNTTTPDFSVTEQRPEIVLNGPQTIFISTGEDYLEEGATATDGQDGDLTSNIVLVGSVNTDAAGDYIVTYSVSDSHGNSAIAKSRIVRVSDGQVPTYTLRPVGETLSHLGYIEQLPNDYGSEPDKKYPALIYHHGGGGDAATMNESPTSALINIVNLSGGPATLAANGMWNPESPLIALTPQRSVLRNPSIARMNAFVDYALANYQIDPTRIYMAGHSQGGLVSLQYAVEYPEKIAAIVPLAGGFFSSGIPQNVCNAATVSAWGFHSQDDNVINISIGRAAIQAINNCGPLQRARFTIFDGLGHQSHQYVMSLNGMGNALAGEDLFNQNLYRWMMNQSTLLRP